MYQLPYLRWVSDHLLRFPTVDVELYIDGKLYERESSDSCFVAGKSRSMLESLISVMEDRWPRNIVELGIYKGGSIVLYNEIFSPQRLLAFDRDKAQTPIVNYAKKHPQVILASEVDQSDASMISKYCREVFGEMPLDLVIDDASHLHAPTVDSFRELFPRLQPGGMYVIEDWAWAHWEGDVWQKEEWDHFRGKLPLSNLILHLVLLSASNPQCISRVIINSHQAIFERGKGEFKPGFDFESMILNRGLPLPKVFKLPL